MSQRVVSAARLAAPRSTRVNDFARGYLSRLGGVAAAAAAVAVLGGYSSASCDQPNSSGKWIPPDDRQRTSAASKPAPSAAAAETDYEPDDEGVLVVNWSGTHSVVTKALHEPETTDELEALVADCHRAGRKLRVVGSAISPNGLGLSAAGEMVSLTFCDSVLAVDPARLTVRVQAGARVSQVVEELRKHGLTLQNYASIREQQLGGFIQAGAHGTGARIPPVDDQVREEFVLFVLKVMLKVMLKVIAKLTFGRIRWGKCC